LSYNQSVNVRSCDFSAVRPPDPAGVHESCLDELIHRHAEDETMLVASRHIDPRRLSLSLSLSQSPHPPPSVADKFAICENDVGVVVGVQSSRAARFRAQFNQPTSPPPPPAVRRRRPAVRRRSPSRPTTVGSFYGYRASVFRLCYQLTLGYINSSLLRAFTAYAFLLSFCVILFR